MPVPDPSLWSDMLAFLKRNHADTCRHWFEDLEPIDFNGGILHIRANSPIQQHYLSKRCAEAFNDAAQTITGALVAVHFVNSDYIPTADPMISIPAQGPHAALDTLPATRMRKVIANPLPNFDADDDQIVLSPDYSFENFVTGPANRLAHAAAVAVSEFPGKDYNPLFVHGDVGLGKTHLLQAICQKILNQRPDARICYLSCDTFVNNFMEAVEKKQMSDFRYRYRHVDILLIDDIHFLTNRERTQEEFFHTFNTLYQANKQIVLSSDSPPNDIPQLEQRLVSRFNWGLVAPIDKPCFETRMAILKKKAQIRGLEIPEDAVSLIASRIDTNIRELEGAITKVHTLAILRGAPISLDVTREAIGDGQPPSPPQLTLQNIIAAVSNFYGVELKDLLSKRRHRSITIPRHACMYLARKRTRFSLEEIGGFFGGRDHTTILHGIKTTEDRMAADPEFRAQINSIDEELLRT